jgi:endonuclease YncB( thermonuclease family)
VGTDDVTRLAGLLGTLVLLLALTACTGPDDEQPGASGTATTRASTKAPPGKSFGRLEEGVVGRVNDGDTITLDDGRKIRLLQIDAPELYDDCYGKDARREAERLMPPGTRVTLQKDPDLDERDTYGRLLRYVEANGLNMNAELVVFGAAVPYFYRGERGRYARDLLAAVEQARSKRLGLWRACPAAKLEPGIGSVTGRA